MGLFDGSGGNGQGRGVGIQVIIGAIIALVGVVSYYSTKQTNPTTGEVQRVGKITPQQEIQMGQQAAPEMEAQMGGLVSPNSLDAQRVAYIGNQVLQHSSAKNNPYKFDFHLLNDSRTINAFALPGGQIFITKALYDRLSTEAQVAAVLGHEITHVVGRHTAEHMAESKMSSAIVTGTGVAASGDPNHPGRGQEAAALAAMVAQMKNLQYSRGDESEADERGLGYMTEAGYDPRAMRQVMEILQQASGGGGQPEFMQTHPNPANRIQKIDEWIKQKFPAGVPGNLTQGRSLKEG